MKKFIAFGILAIFAAGQSQAAERALGSGIVYSAPNTALFRNATALTDASKLSLQGIWRFEIDSPSVSVVANQGSIGFGAGYRKEGGSDGVDVLEAGAAAKLSMLDFGITIRNRNLGNDGINADLATRFNLGKAAISVVGRDMDGGFDRIDAGIGVDLDTQVTAEFNLKKPEPFDSGIWLLDFGLVFNAQKISLSVGYDMTYSSDSSDGDLHAGLSYEATNQIFAEGYYRPFAQEWSSDKWALGARAVF